MPPHTICLPCPPTKQPTSPLVNQADGGGTPAAKSATTAPTSAAPSTKRIDGVVRDAVDALRSGDWKKKYSPHDTELLSKATAWLLARGEKVPPQN